MKNAFIFHGTGGYPEENWFPWLKGELEKDGIKVIVPQFPTPDDQSLENWLKVFDQHKDKVSSETIFVGHSIAAAFILSILEDINIQIKACFLVAGFTHKLNDELDKINATFIDKDFDWPKIKENCQHFCVYHSDNDPYVGLENGKELAKNLDVDLTFVPNAGHFNSKAGYLQFPDLLKKIEEVL